MTLINLRSTVLNADGTTTVYGLDGNEIEDIYSGKVSIYADPSPDVLTAGIPIWYAPAYSSTYFQSILDNPNLFETVADDIKVFKLYGYQTAWTTSSLKALFAYATADHIQIGVEAPALVAAEGQLGYGVEGFGTPGSLVSFLDLVKSVGGTLSYIGWDEPWYFGSASTGYYTDAQIATQVAAAATTAESVFPDIQIGDIEPVGGVISNPTALEAWWSAYDVASGKPFTSFQADLQSWVPGWQADFASVITASHANGTLVGAIINGIGSADTDDTWATQAVANANQILSTPDLRPDFLVVQSWQAYPSETADPATAGTLASVVADVVASERSALAIPAVAQYGTAGLLQNVVWSDGAEVTQNGTNFELLAPNGTVLLKLPWTEIENFSFDPNSAMASLSLRLPAPAVVPGVPGYATQTVSIGVGVTGLQITAPVASTSSLTLALATASQTGFSGSGITNNATPAITGTAIAGAVVDLQLDGVSLGSVTASETGAWTYTFATELTNGAHVVEAAVTDSTTDTTVQQNTVVTVDTATMAQTAIALATNSDNGVPGADFTPVVDPEFDGSAAPNAEVTLTIDGHVAGYTYANINGAWDYQYTTALTVGTHTVTATASNIAGTLSSATMSLLIQSPSKAIAYVAPTGVMTVTDATFASGPATVYGGMGGYSTVTASGDTSASTGKSLTYIPGTAAVTFTGGFENDTVDLPAPAVGGDVLNGGNGTNTLVLTGPGNADLGGISNFGTVDLAAGNSNVTVTDTTLSGGTVTLVDGASGGNVSSAAGDTSASIGKSLIYDAGSGADAFTGGFENDTIYAGTGLGTYTAGTGSDSFVFIKDTLATQTLANFQVKSDDILVYGTADSNGFDLGTTVNALDPTVATAITASIFVANETGSFTASTQHFAYDTANGDLYYGATGSSGSKSLLTTLTGEPAFTAVNLLFEH
jgi:hypothetical protein